MKNFFNLFKMFREEGDLASMVYAEGWQLPPKIIPTTESPKCPVVQEFFTGKNVYFEDISTYKGFSYEATVSSETNCTAEQFEKEVEAGLKELGLNAKTSVSKEVTTKMNNKYVVRIHVGC